MNCDQPGVSADFGNRQEPTPSGELFRFEVNSTDYQVGVSDRFLQALFEAALDAIMVADDEGRYIDANPAASELFGLSKEDLLGRKILDFTEPGYDFSQNWQSFPQEERVRGEFRLLRLDGTVREVEYAATANFLPHRHLSVLRDISDRKRLELMLRHSEAKLSRIINSAIASIQSVRLFSDRTWQYDYISSGCEKVFGYTAEEFIANATLWQERILPEETEGVVKLAWENILAEQSVTIEYRFHHKDNTIRWISSNLTYQQDEATNSWIVTSVHTDITAQKQAEIQLRLLNSELEQRVEQRTAELSRINQELTHEIIERQQLEATIQRSEAKLNDILNSLSAGINCFRVFANRDWQYEYLSAGNEIVFGFTPQELMADKYLWMSRVLPEDWQTIILPAFENIFAEKITSLEYRFYHKDGSLRWISAKFTSRYDAVSDAWIVTSVGMDISDRKRVEEALLLTHQRLSFHLENSPLALVEWNNQGRVKHWSLQAEKMFGWKTEEVLGKSWDEWQFVYETDVESVTQNATSLQNGTSPRNVHYNRNYTRDGNILDCEWYNSSLLDESGQVISVFSQVLDITDRKKTEAALKESEERFREITETINEVFFVDNPDRSQTIYISPAYEKIWQRSRESLYENPDSWLESIHPDDRQRVCATFSQMTQGEPSEKEYRIIRPDGSIRWIMARTFPIRDKTGQLLRHIGSAKDITDRKLVEAKLRQSEASLLKAQKVAHVGSWEYDITTEKITWSEELFHIVDRDLSLLEPSPTELMNQLIYPDDQPAYQHLVVQALTQGLPYKMDLRILRPDGTIRFVETRGEAIQNEQGQVIRIIGTGKDITERKQLELTLQQKAEREHLFSLITQQIRQSLNLNQILNTTVTQVRQVLQADRVLIYRFQPNWSGFIVVESVVETWMQIQGTYIKDPCFAKGFVEQYKQGRILKIEDIHQAALHPCHLDLLTTFQVKANLIVPILQERIATQKNQTETEITETEATTEDQLMTPHLWGLLIVHQCSGSRQWQASEVDFLVQLATQVGIAIQQSELYHRIKHLNANLEIQVQERTAQLKKALEFEALLKQITDKVRDSLDESQILQTAVEALAMGLKVDCCDARLYNLKEKYLTISYEYISSDIPSAKGKKVPLDYMPDVYEQLLQSRYVQCNSLSQSEEAPRNIESDCTLLICPLVDDQSVLGDICLYRAKWESFHEQEVRLIQQVANQCAIALRQSRLYQAAQVQVTELERINRLKDDFLNTISHELRTPMSNIKMATEMLEIILERSGVLSEEGNPVDRYFQILKSEEKQEISLINNLLDLTELDADKEPLNLRALNLEIWLSYIAESFMLKIQNRQQQLVINLPPELPNLTTDLTYLERIFNELLNNACKYSPNGETITISADAIAKGIQLKVSNSGVEIPATECDRIFDKFYRIPNNDPWKYSGTGLGLALVKKLVQRLGANIYVESSNNQVSFILQFWDG